MSSSTSPALPDAQALLTEQLRIWAAAEPRAVALRHKDRGQWRLWRRAAVLNEVERLAAGLRSLGLHAGTTMVVGGAIEPRLLLITLAARTLGAKVVMVAAADEGDASPVLLDAHPVAVVVAQSRAGLMRWLRRIGTTRQPVRLVFDHDPADQPVSHASVTSFGALRRLGVLRKAGPTLPRAAAAGMTVPANTDLHRRHATIWIEETTHWLAGFDQLMATWLTDGDTLAFPEGAAATTRDRRELQPARWIASGPQIAAAARQIEALLPREKSLAGWLVRRSLARAVASGRAGWVAALLRHRLGLSALRGVEWLGAAPDADTHASAYRLFRGLGLTPVPWGG